MTGERYPRMKSGLEWYRVNGRDCTDVDAAGHRVVLCSVTGPSYDAESTTDLSVPSGRRRVPRGGAPGRARGQLLQPRARVLVAHVGGAEALMIMGAREVIHPS